MFPFFAGRGGVHTAGIRSATASGAAARDTAATSAILLQQQLQQKKAPTEVNELTLILSVGVAVDSVT
jgi:hypothetical protein